MSPRLLRLVIARWWVPAPEGSTWEAINKAWAVLAALAECAERQDLTDSVARSS